MEGLKNLLYFAYGSLVKGVCSDSGDKVFPEKVKRYLEGEEKLEGEILEGIYEELPHAIPELNDMAAKRGINPFSLENINSYIFEKHSCEVMPACRVIEGIVKKINQEKQMVKVLADGKAHSIRYLTSLEKNIRLGEKIYFHHGWMIFPPSSSS